MIFSRTTFFLCTLLLSLFFVQSCDEDNRFELNFDDAPAAYDISQAERDTTIAGGVQVYIFEEGDGPFEVVPKDIIIVEITARNEEGRVVDSSFNNRPSSSGNRRVMPNLTPTPQSTTRYGIRQVELLVPGLRKALLGMKEGGVRTIVIPREFGFNDEFVSNARRTGPLLTPNLDLRDQTITYDVTLIAIN